MGGNLQGLKIRKIIFFILRTGTSTGDYSDHLAERILFFFLAIFRMPELYTVPTKLKTSNF
jgi:hypothetical protein